MYKRYRYMYKIDKIDNRLNSTRELYSALWVI